MSLVHDARGGRLKQKMEKQNQEAPSSWFILKRCQMPTQAANQV
jgi:hypothetical protein